MGIRENRSDASRKRVAAAPPPLSHPFGFGFGSVGRGGRVGKAESLITGLKKKKALPAYLSREKESASRQRRLASIPE